jgi:hypothetical protein
MSEGRLQRTGDFMKSKIKRMFSGTSSYHKIDIATGQLETAIRLFLNDGSDMFSAVTLAAAAGEILHRLVLNAGREPFVDYVVKVNDFRNPGKTPARSHIISHIHRILSINRLKHFDPGEDEVVELDAEECALAAILKAMTDYKTLTGNQTGAVTAMLAWAYVNLDSEEFMKNYAKAPEKLK